MKNKGLHFIIFVSLMMVASNPTLPQSREFSAELWNVIADETIFDNTVWWINKGTGPSIQFPMAVFVDGVDKGTTYLLSFGYQTGDTWPEIAAIYNTGYLRLVPPALPYGTSFILGPAYWGSDEIYAHTVQISRIDIDTTGAMPSGPIRLTIHARDFSISRWPDYNLDITYNATLPDPTVDATQMVITESFSVAKAFSLSMGRQAGNEGFKWVQFSSMYIDEVQHDSDSALYVDSNEKIELSKFSEVGCNHSIFSSPQALSSLNPWIEVRHSDDFGWQGNTPNTRIAINSPSLVGLSIPQGYITCTSDPNDDNVSVWINYDAAPMSFKPGDLGSIDYTLTSQDNPREPPMTFSDVALSHWAWSWIERLYNAGITGGCGTSPLQYCPEVSVTRAQMAVFLERGLHYPVDFTPPNVLPTFNDTIGHWAEDWIEALRSDGITGGCGINLYCPEDPVTRAQMAVFLLKSKYGSSYTPPAVGSSTGFNDVPVTHWAASWIKQLEAEGITGGCGTGIYCPESSVTRAQMAVFLVRTFDLP